MRFMLKFIIASCGLISGPGYAAALLDTVTSKMLQMPLEYKIDGVIEARQQATLSVEVAGKIEAVNFDVDDFVKQGEVVLRIRDREYVAQQKQASAAVDEAKANLQDMQLAFKLNEGLRKQKLISQAVFDKSSANLQAAQARMASADASLAQADELLSHTVLRAPYSGVVERHVEPGESVSPGLPIMTGYALGQLRVSANVQRPGDCADFRHSDFDHADPGGYPGALLRPQTARVYVVLKLLCHRCLRGGQSTFFGACGVGLIVVEIKRGLTPRVLKTAVIPALSRYVGPRDPMALT